MRTDAQLIFVAPGSPLSLVAGAGLAISTNWLDMLGIGYGQPVPPNVIIGDQYAGFGQQDSMGVGGLRPELNVVIGTALNGAAGLTLNVALQAAADNNGNAGTTQDIANQDGITIAQGTAGTVIFRSPWLPPFPANLRPRFLRLQFRPVAAGGAVPSGAFTAGTIASALVTVVRDDYFAKYAQKNFVVQ